MSEFRKSRRIALLAVALPLVGARAAILALEPRRRAVDQLTPIDLEKDVPVAFTGWAVDPRSQLQVVSPTLSSALADAYDQSISRVYRAAAGDQVKLSVAYGSNQREKKLHLPAGCYGAQGYKVSRFGELAFPLGKRALAATTFMAAAPDGAGEFVAYWIVYGQLLATDRMQGRYELFKQEAEGLIPDGILFRVSIDTRRAEAGPDEARALQDYVARLHAAMGAPQAARYFPAARA